MRCSVILVKVEIMMCKVKNILKDIYSVKSKLFYLIYLGSSSAWSKCSLPEFRKVRTYWPWTPVLPLIWPQNPIWYDFPTGEEEKFSFGWFNKRSKTVTHYRIFFIISKRFIYFYYYFSFCWRAPGTPLCTPVSPQVPLLMKNWPWLLPNCYVVLMNCSYFWLNIQGLFYPMMRAITAQHISRVLFRSIQTLSLLKY